MPRNHMKKSPNHLTGDLDFFGTESKKKALLDFHSHYVKANEIVNTALTFVWSQPKSLEREYGNIKLTLSL